MILAVDVKYGEDCAVAAGVIFSGWNDETPEREVVSCLATPAEYQPGQFYRRELPCILKLLKENDLRPDIIIVDGFVYLDGVSRPGLGKHLFDALHGDVAVIGVAKTPFKGISPRYQLFRGGSSRPLYITAEGIHLDIAKDFIREMHGKHRLPTMLKRVDHLSRAASYCGTQISEAGEER
jgi:deoxyribonuclease V